MLPSIEGVGMVNGSTMSILSDPATTVAQINASLHSLAVDLRVLDQSRFPIQASLPWRNSQSPHQGNAPMTHWSLRARRPNASPSSTCITVSMIRLMPGTSKNNPQYQGRSMSFNHAKK